LRQVANDITVAGVKVDKDEALTEDYGQWAPPNPNGGSAMELSTPVPGTATDAHPGDRTVQDGLHDEMRKRAVLYGEAPIPAGTPLADVLAMPKELSTVLAQVQANGAGLSEVKAALTGMTLPPIDVDVLVDKLAERIVGRLIELVSRR
jgi:hypothetical protein